MASYTLVEQFRTLSISTSGDDVTTGNFDVKIRNIGANVISYSEIGSPTGAATVGQQSSLIPAGAGGKIDDTILRRNTKYFFKAATGATLLAFDQLPAYFGI